MLSQQSWRLGKPTPRSYFKPHKRLQNLRA
jgi:hypothetical protein